MFELAYVLEWQPNLAWYASKIRPFRAVPNSCRSEVGWSARILDQVIVDLNSDSLSKPQMEKDPSDDAVLLDESDSPKRRAR